MKNWPVWTAYDRQTRTVSSPVLKGLGDENLFKNAVVWSERHFLMGAATKSPMAPLTYDPVAGTLSGSTFGAGEFRRIPRAKVHFMIESVAKFLDAPGEYFFDENGPKAGRLYLWPPGGSDPNRVVYEIARSAS